MQCFARFRTPFLSGALLVCGVLAVYIPALGAGFIWDDPLLLTENPLLWIPGGLRDIWTGAHLPDYIPLTLTGFWLEWRLWGADPLGYHLVNILLHAANVVLFWRVLRRLEVPGAWVAALLFALHPMNVASVAWVAERKNTLSLFFVLVSALFYLKAEGEKRRLPYFLALLAGIAAMLSKGTAVVLPALLMALFWWKNGRVSRRECLRLLPLLLAAALFSWVTLRFQAQGLLMAQEPESLGFRLLTATWAAGFYLWKTFVPLGLAPVYPQWKIDPHSVAAYLPALGLLGLFLLGLRLPERSRRGALLGVGVFGISILPVLGLLARPVYFDQAPAADWWNYLPMLGLCGLAGAAFALVPERRRAVASAGMAGVVCVLGVLTWKQAEIYDSLESYSRAALEKNPRAWMARTNLGMVFANRAQYDAAIGQYTRALEENPSCFEARNNLAVALSSLGRFPEAEAQLRQVLQVTPTNAKALNNLGSVLFQTGRFDEAVRACQASLAKFPFAVEAYNNLGLALAAKKDYRGALHQYQTALTLTRSNPAVWFNAGNAFAALNRHDLAAGAFAHATNVSPGMASASNRFAQELILLHQPEKAEAELTRLFRAVPRRAADPALLETRAEAQAARGNRAGAGESLRAAIQAAKKAGDEETVKRLNGKLAE